MKFYPPLMKGICSATSSFDEWYFWGEWSRCTIWVVPHYHQLRTCVLVSKCRTNAIKRWTISAAMGISRMHTISYLPTMITKIVRVDSPSRKLKNIVSWYKKLLSSSPLPFHLFVIHLSTRERHIELNRCRNWFDVYCICSKRKRWCTHGCCPYPVLFRYWTLKPQRQQRLQIIRF